MRWINNNEYKYYPSGDKLSIDPKFASKASQKYRSKKSNTIGGWRELGPFAEKNITVHYSVGIRRIEDFYVDPNNNKKIYICSRIDGLWKTANEGSTWDSISTENCLVSDINSIAVDPLDFNHVHVVLQNANNNYSFGVYESLNGGTSFNETRFNPTTLDLGGLGSSFKIYTITHHPTITNLLFLGISNGLSKTTNNFSPWLHLVDKGHCTS